MMRAGEDYGVEVIVAYENKRVGQVIFPPGTLRQRLIQRGFAKALTAKRDKPAADSAARVNRQKPLLVLK